MTKRILTAALETGDLPAAVAALVQDIVFHSPILATTGNEVRGHAKNEPALAGGARVAVRAF